MCPIIRMLVVVCATAVATASETVCRTTETIDPLCAQSSDEACGWQGSEAFVAGLGSPCIFPFVYKNVTYNSCTSEDHHRPWCATSANFAPHTGRWGNCEASTCLQDQDVLQVPCGKVPTCCASGWSTGDTFAPPVEYQATYITGVFHDRDRDPVIEDLLALDDHNQDRDTRQFSNLKSMFLAEMNPVELGFLLNDTRVEFVECNGIVTSYTTRQGTGPGAENDGYVGMRVRRNLRGH